MTLSLFLSLLPINLASRCGAFLMLQFGSLIKKNKRAIKHVDMIFDNLNSKKVISNMWGNIGRNLAELMLLKKILKQKHIRLTVQDKQCKPNLQIKNGMMVFQSQLSCTYQIRVIYLSHL